jgi:hypothetical protein
MGAVFRAGPQSCPQCGVELPARKVELPTAQGIELVDLDKLPKLPTRAITISLIAKYPGKCKGCGGRIRIGQQIYWIKGTGARHADCRQAVAA